MLKVRQMSPIEIKLDKFAPIHGCLPSKSFANYIAPFCYTSTSAEEVYQLFRHVYANYLGLLNTVSSLPDSILSTRVYTKVCAFFSRSCFGRRRRDW